MLEMDPARLPALAEQRSDDNLRLRNFLKRGNLSQAEVDGRFRTLFEQVRQEIDCTRCARCCRELPVRVSQSEARRLAERFNLSISDFRGRYLRTSDWGPVFTVPCSFLADSRCSCYEDRPQVCRSYPHLHKPDMPARLLTVLQNVATCLIVYNVLERMKSELGNRWRHG